MLNWMLLQYNLLLLCETRWFRGKWKFHWNWNAGPVFLGIILITTILMTTIYFVAISHIYTLLYLHIYLMSVHFLNYYFGILYQAWGRGHLYICMPVQMLLYLVKYLLYTQWASITGCLLRSMSNMTSRCMEVPHSVWYDSIVDYI